MKKIIHMIYCTMLLGFLLGIHNGQIALWKDEDPQPMMILPYKAESLPIKERMLLKKGIRFDSLEQIEKIVSEYLSH